MCPPVLARELYVLRADTQVRPYTFPLYILRPYTFPL